MFGWWLYLQKPSIGSKCSMTTVWENRRSTISTVGEIGEIKKILRRHKAWGQTCGEVMQYVFASFQSITTAVFGSYSNELNIYDSWLWILSMPTKSYSYCPQVSQTSISKTKKNNWNWGIQTRWGSCLFNLIFSLLSFVFSSRRSVEKKKKISRSLDRSANTNLQRKNLLVHHVLKKYQGQHKRR